MSRPRVVTAARRSIKRNGVRSRCLPVGTVKNAAISSAKTVVKSSPASIGSPSAPVVFPTMTYRIGSLPKTPKIRWDKFKEFEEHLPYDVVTGTEPPEICPLDKNPSAGIAQVTIHMSRVNQFMRCMRHLSGHAVYYGSSGDRSPVSLMSVDRQLDFVHFKKSEMNRKTLTSYRGYHGIDEIVEVGITIVRVNSTCY